MTITVAIRHNTVYQFDRPVEIFPHVVRLRPAPHSRTPIKSYSLKIEPDSHFINWQQDPFSNYLARLVFPEKARKLSLAVEVIAEMTVINPFDFFLEESAEHIPFKYDKQLLKDLAPYLALAENGSKLKAWVKQIPRRKTPTVQFLVEINQRLQQEIGYEIRLEPGVQTCEQTLTRKSGSCRDTGWLLVQILRHLGLAARFVSGYLVQLKPDVKSLDGPSGPTEDFTDLHAWAEVYIPGAGWVGLDPTSGLFAAEGHIPLACTPDPFSAAPVTGAIDECQVEFSYENKVVRVHEDPRVTKPFSTGNWRRINALGKQVDSLLNRQKVKLTMGGEPTFVSVDDMESAQWNTAALGKDKRQLAGNLLQALKKQFGPKGVLQFGQGKWYPGEPVPRWALGLFWREDGKALWKNRKYLGDESSPGDLEPALAGEFIRKLAGNLRVNQKHSIPAYEDTWHYLEAEGKLPANVTVDDNKLKDPLERNRLRNMLTGKLGEPVGYVLPLAWLEEKDGKGWYSCRWYFRREKLFLLPGDSSMGFRLPLGSIPWQAPEDSHVDHEADPFSGEEEAALADTGKRRARKIRQTDTIFQTALCVQVRDGRLYVFLPPVTRLNHYVDLLNAIEEIATELKVPVVLEGYHPPRDRRLRKLLITPDPGVIEVNVHPAGSWDEMIDIIRKLYDLAHKERLGTEKFMVDGKHSGTGGGNHVTLGAARAEDSPFLRRPHLLGSMIRYWQNHPSLSYLFSGQFIGPTSQSPRVDEARDDNLYELDIALQQLGEGESLQPWKVDRLLRNFLVDLTGNTHRAEFCIDKLYSPDSSTGRLGLLEFRNFEMPPHWQMSAVQMLLIRALVAHFWKHPYRRDLIPWGTELHDRFMLPHFIWQDLSWVIADLKEAGFDFDLQWFEAFQEFRFPHYGTVNVRGMEVEITGAIEPWHVLGEESSGQGTARYVDSSVERLQVLVRHMTSNRFIVTCNGRKIPLQYTGREGEYVAGVRYKAWSPYSALHPLLPVNSPLVFDVVDTFNNRSLGGCTYYVSHPGGRNYDTFPVNAMEAEARRVARFSRHGHSQDGVEFDTRPPHPSQPYTLDLRYKPR